LIILAIFLVLLLLKGQLNNFLRLSNLQLILHQAAITAVVALGMLLIVISGGIDLSVGSVVALATVATMTTYEGVLAASGSMTQASLAGMLVGVLTGGVCGLFNGLVITRLRVSPFVTTLGMYSIARGLAFWWTNKQRMTFRGDTPAWVEALQRTESDWLVFDPGVWSAALLAVLVALMLHCSVLGRHCYAIGSNEATARLCGVNVQRRKVMIYVLAGLLTGWGGVLMFAQIGSGDPDCGKGLELNVIAAVVIGGASLSGGRGTVVGALLGVFLLSILDSLLVFLNVSIELKNILLGVVVILNTALSRLRDHSAM
jgi:ribose transport system permease protein